MSDELLEWMSFRRSGSLADLPSNSSARPRRILGDLSLLGHIEVADSGDWQIAPPTLACLPRTSDGTASAIACGARTPGVIRRLRDACHTAGVSMDVRESGGSPSRIQLTGSTSDLARTGDLAGMYVQQNAGYSLLACVPSIAAWPRRSCQMAGGQIDTVRRFSGSEAKWNVSSLQEAQTAAKGFFRIKRDWDWVSILKWGPGDCAYIDDRAGRLLVAARRRHMRWNAETQTLSLPTNLFPPVLIARSLVLCTGQLPALDHSSMRVSFGGIPAEMLRLVLSITGLRLA